MEDYKNNDNKKTVDEFTVFLSWFEGRRIEYDSESEELAVAFLYGKFI